MNEVSPYSDELEERWRLFLTRAALMQPREWPDIREGLRRIGTFDEGAPNPPSLASNIAAHRQAYEAFRHRSAMLLERLHRPVIEITPAMSAAVVDVLCNYDPETDPVSEVAERLILALLEVM